MIRIIRDTERFCTEYMDSKFYYRRISAGKIRQIQKDCTKKGLVDMSAVGLAIIQHCLLDWENVGEGSDGNSIPFSKDLIELLPEDVIDHLTPLLREGSPEEDELGN